MSRLAAILVGLVAAPAAVAAGYWNGKAEKPEVVKASLRLNAPLVSRPGDGAAEAGRYFAALNRPPPPAPPVSTAPPPPPPPDVAYLFRRDLTAVLLNPPAEPRVVLTGARTLKAGDTFQDGWKVASLTADTAVLAKGKERRSIGLYTPPPAAMVASVNAANRPLAVTPPPTLNNGAGAGKVSPSAVAAVVSNLRADGMPAGQIAQVQRLVEAGTMDQSGVLQLMNTFARGRSLSAKQINDTLMAFARAGAMPERSVPGFAQNIIQMQNSQAIQNAMRPTPAPGVGLPAIPPNAFAPARGQQRGGFGPGARGSDFGGRGGNGGGRRGPPQQGPAAAQTR